MRPVSIDPMKDYWKNCEVTLRQAAPEPPLKKMKPDQYQQQRIQMPNLQDIFQQLLQQEQHEQLPVQHQQNKELRNIGSMLQTSEFHTPSPEPPQQQYHEESTRSWHEPPQQ